jgi:hypothetical protein
MAGNQFRANFALPPHGRESQQPRRRPQSRKNRAGETLKSLENDAKSPLSAVIVHLDGPALSVGERALGLHVRSLSRAPERHEQWQPERGGEALWRVWRW